jgi:putative DNA primase/helicase
MSIAPLRDEARAATRTWAATLPSGEGDIVRLLVEQFDAVLVDDDSAATVADHRGSPEGGRDRGLDDIGNAARFVDDHNKALRYVPASGRWLRWDGARWADDDVLEHRRRAKETARLLAAEAAAERDEQRRKALLDHARRSSAEPRLRALLSIAASDPRLVVRPADLDCDPWVLNTPTGTVDLRTGELRPHRREDLLTLLAGAGFDQKAAAPRWEAHLRRCLGSPHLIAFLQRLAGLSALGVTREHLLAILFGPGANGKTVTVNAITGALDEYALASTADLLLQGNRGRGQASPELADLRGRRLVSISETPEDGRLATERVKAITGGDPITARYLYGQPFTFQPSHTIWLLTNHKPRVLDDGDAIWRRIVLVPFTEKIPPAEQDPDLGDKLATERAGILRWIVDGAIDYLAQGLNPPTAVTNATATYREDEDQFGGFLDACTIAEEDASAGATELLNAYEAWATANGAPDLSGNALSEKLLARGFERKRVKTGTRYQGLRLRENGGTLDA